MKMLAATQPFISGAISKTINMPREWTIEQIKKAYYDSWMMMLKGVALYRDGCKLSQPLNTTLEENQELNALLNEQPEETATKEIHKKIVVGKKNLTLIAKLQEDQLQSINATMDGLTPAQEVLINALTNVINTSINNGLSPSLIATQSLNLEGHPLVKELSIFLMEFEFAHNPHKPIITSTTSLTTTSKPTIITKTISTSEKQKCRSCGAVQLRQNGTCMLCEVCGETSGCS